LLPASGRSLLPPKRAGPRLGGVPDGRVFPLRQACLARCAIPSAVRPHRETEEDGAWEAAAERSRRRARREGTNSRGEIDTGMDINMGASTREWASTMGGINNGGHQQWGASTMGVTGERAKRISEPYRPGVLMGHSRATSSGRYLCTSSSDGPLPLRQNAMQMRSRDVTSGIGLCHRAPPAAMQNRGCR
jgi:hypothetical protein